MAAESVLSVLAAVEGLLGLLLAAHSISPSVSFPAIMLCRFVGTGAGRAVAMTVFACIFLLFVVALNDVRTLASIAPKAAENPENSLYHADKLSRAQVQALLAFVSWVLMPLLGALTSEITKHEKLKVSQAAMLKQVKGLQQEYDRVTKEKEEDGVVVAGAGDEKLRARVNELRNETDKLKDQLEASEKAKKAAEASATAMKQQSQALEREYDRLLAMKDKMEKDMAATDDSRKDR